MEPQPKPTSCGFDVSRKMMIRLLCAFCLSLTLASCHHRTYDFGPESPLLEAKVVRVSPEDSSHVTFRHHSTEAYIDVQFLILEPEEMEGQSLNLRIALGYEGPLFDANEFRITIRKNVLEGKNRERVNSDGTIRVWADTISEWNFEAFNPRIVTSANQSSHTTPASAPR